MSVELDNSFFVVFIIVGTRNKKVQKMYFVKANILI